MRMFSEAREVRQPEFVRIPPILRAIEKEFGNDLPEFVEVSRAQVIDARKMGGVFAFLALDANEKADICIRATESKGGCDLADMVCAHYSPANCNQRLIVEGGPNLNTVFLSAAINADRINRCIIRFNEAAYINIEPTEIFCLDRLDQKDDLKEAARKHKRLRIIATLQAQDVWDMIKEIANEIPVVEVVTVELK